MDTGCVFVSACQYNGVKKCRKKCGKKISVQYVESLRATSGKR